MTDPFSAAKTGAAAVGHLVKATGDTPGGVKAKNNLGETAATVTEAINNLLLPIAAVNFAFKRAKEYFSTDFAADLEERAKAIPEEHLVEPKASIAGPALQGLAFACDEDELKELFLALLVSAMDGRSPSDAHPAFAEVIKQLDATDAKEIRPILSDILSVPICEVHLRMKNQSGFHVIATHVLDWRNEGDPEIQEFRPQAAAMIANWIRLGLVSVDYTTWLSPDDAYAWADTNPFVVDHRTRLEPEGVTVRIQKGILRSTPFGRKFAKAVGITQSVLPSF